MRQPLVNIQTSSSLFSVSFLLSASCFTILMFLINNDARRPKPAIKEKKHIQRQINRDRREYGATHPQAPQLRIRSSNSPYRRARRPVSAPQASGYILPWETARRSQLARSARTWQDTWITRMRRRARLCLGLLCRPGTLRKGERRYLVEVLRE